MSIVDSITENYFELTGQKPRPSRISHQEMPGHIGGMTLFYQDGSNEIVLNSSYVDDPRILSHELAHSLTGFIGDTKLDEGYAKALESVETAYRELKQEGDADISDSVELAYRRLLLEEHMTEKELETSPSWLGQYYLDTYLVPGLELVGKMRGYLTQTGYSDLSDFHSYVQSSSGYSEVGCSGVC